MDPVDDQRALVAALRRADAYPHPVEAVAHRETHISHILLAGDFAYKIKKPLDLGFLDFTELAARRYYCHEECRLNARLAPQIYLAVVAVTGTVEAPRIDGEGPPIEYAVKMRRFDDAYLLDRLATAGDLDRALIASLARRVADFHEHADANPPEPGMGSAAAVAAPARENFAQIRPRVDAATAERLDALSAWTERRIEALEAAFEQRRRAGRVRECHGDMHLRNIALVDGEPAIFDGIEFNAAMRWIDVAADVAFMVMDLDRWGMPALGGRFLDDWLAATGDYNALKVLPYYLVYRALVRAKIAAIRLDQLDDAADRHAAQGELATYLDLAERYAAAHAPAVALTRGVAGSGKSAAAAVLVERIGAVRLRADVERRRLYPDPDPAVRYAPAAHDAVYERLHELAETVIDAGFPAVVDATCLERARRAPFFELARRRQVPVRVLDVDLPEALLIERIRARQRAGDDASEAGPEVMRAQRERLEALDDTESTCRVAVDNTGPEPAVPATGLAHARGLGPDTATHA